MTENGNGPVELPDLVSVDESFSQRLPSQRVLDLIARQEPGGFGELVQSQPFRLVAFRALLRDFPDYDPTALWLHAYDVEVQVQTAPDPTEGRSTTPERDSAASGT